jgi:hypothetical protein
VTENVNPFTQQPAATVEPWKPGAGLFGLGIGNLRDPSIPARGYAGKINGQEGYIEEYTTLDGRTHKRIIRNPKKTEEWFGTAPNAPQLAATQQKEDEQKARAEGEAAAALRRELEELRLQRGERGEDRADLRGYRTLSEGRLARGQELGHEIDKGELKVSGYDAVSGRLRAQGDIASNLMNAGSNALQAKVGALTALADVGLRQDEFGYRKQIDAYNAYVGNMKYLAELQSNDWREKQQNIRSGLGHLTTALTGRPPI